MSSLPTARGAHWRHGCLHSLDWITGLDYWTGLLDSRYFMQKRIYDVIIDTPPSCFAKRAVLTERFGLFADGNVSD